MSRSRKDEKPLLTSAEAVGDLEFRVLGPLEVMRGGRALRLGGSRQRTLLALLLVRANSIVSRYALIEGLWEGDPPEGAAHALDAAVSRLRKALAPDGADGHETLLTYPAGYLLRIDPDELDLHRFERLLDEGRHALAEGEAAVAGTKLRAALSLWRGRPFEGAQTDALPAAELERLDELRAAALEERVEADLALGRHAAIVGELQALVAAHPLRERLRAQLMVALYRCDRQVEALRVYRDARSLLVDELGLEPSVRLKELERAILRQDPSLAPSSAMTVVPAGASDAEAAPTRAAKPSRRRVALLAGAVLCGVAVLLAVEELRGGRAARPLAVDDNAVAVLGLDSHRLLSDAVPLQARPSSTAAGAGSIWIASADGDTASRLDPATRTIRQRVAVGAAPSGIVVGHGAVWVANYLEGTVSRIDPATEKVVQTIPVGSGPAAVAVGPEAVWVANSIGKSLSRIAPRTGAVVETVALGVAPTDLVFAEGAVWASSGAGNRIVRVAPSGKVVQTITVGTGPTAIAAGGGAVWVANSLDGTVSRIEPTRNVVTDTFPVGDGPTDVAVVSDSLWVANELDGTLTEIDLRTRRVKGTVRVGGRPQALAAADRKLFVGVAAAGATHRGGTLTLLKQEPGFDSIDPAILFSVTPAQLLGMTNDGLVTLNHAGGSKGVEVVPDLAVSVPTPADGGASYGFQLRPNLRYSTGRVVQARDFRYAIERDFRLHSPGVSFFRGIVGGEACVARPKRCDLSRGIVADDGARTVTFHLSEPDPDFIEKLTLPFAYAVPAGSAPREAGATPLPATGPYMIASYRRGRELRLVRNPQFREWSKAAQPAGYPDKIVWRLDVPLAEALTAIQHGHADWLLNYGPLPSSRVREIETQYASQAHVSPKLATYYYFMNRRVAPFDDVRVRRALNYAIDRARLVRLYGGSTFAQPTCQILPPRLPGYRRYCPYTMHPSASGAWVGPDVPKARRLIAASGTRGMKVTVFGDLVTPDLRYVVSLLRSLGYRASMRIVPGRAYGFAISDSRNRAQIGGGGWAADFPAPSDFIDVKLSCRAFLRANRLNYNDAEYCVAAVDAQIARAQSLEITNPEAAARLWAKIDREIVDDAPWLPTVTPTSFDFVSKRVGNYQFHPLWGILADQLWVR